jgi:hypothetical protein
MREHYANQTNDYNTSPNMSFGNIPLSTCTVAIPISPVKPNSRIHQIQDPYAF